MHWNWNEKKSVHEETRQEKWLWPYIINGIFFVYIFLVQFEKVQHKDVNRRMYRRLFCNVSLHPVTVYTPIIALHTQLICLAV